MLCSECLMTPCSSRCPNAPEPTSVYECKICGDGIYVGDQYVEIEGETCHSECLDVTEVLKLINVDVKTCEEDD